MESLKQKTINGIFWSAIDNFSQKGISFLVGIFLARLLSPKEFGLIGMITVFIAVSESFINSGFSQALIRKKECTEEDYSTVFYFNLFTGIFFFGILFLCSTLISDFFNEPQLSGLIQVLSVLLVIDSLTVIQRTTLAKRIDFKLQTNISIISSLSSGVIAIYMAYNGYGVWSLVYKSISQQFIISILLWGLNKWRPKLIFSRQSFRELFTFGYKLLLSGLIDTIYRNIYYLIIGKYFSAQELGFYTRAQMFKDLPSTNLTGIMSRVTFPVLAQLQDDPPKLKSGYKRMIKVVMYVSTILMVGLAVIAEPLVITLIGEQWRPSIIYLQLLTFVGMMFPLHALNLNMLSVKGRSDLFLKLEIIKKIIAVPAIIIGVIWGIKVMILGMWITTLIGYYLNSYWSGRLINYSMREQIIDIMPGLYLSIVMGVILFFLDQVLIVSYSIKLIVMVITGSIVVISLSEGLKIEAYKELKSIISEKLFRKK